MTYGIITHSPPVCTFRVRVRKGEGLKPEERKAWREIAMAGEQTLEALAIYILDAFDFDDDQPSAFYMNGKAWDDDARVVVHLDELMEYRELRHTTAGTLEQARADDPPAAADISIGEVVTQRGRKTGEFILLLEDVEEWEFGIKLVERKDEVDPLAIYPRIVATFGEGPQQYPPDEWQWDDAEDGESDSLLIFPTQPRPLH